MQIPIGQNRIRSQPTKTKSALTHQNDFISTSSSESDSSDPDSHVSPVKQNQKKKHQKNVGPNQKQLPQKS